MLHKLKFSLFPRGSQRYTKISLGNKMLHEIFLFSKMLHEINFYSREALRGTLRYGSGGQIASVLLIQFSEILSESSKGISVLPFPRPIYR